MSHCGKNSMVVVKGQGDTKNDLNDYSATSLAGASSQGLEGAEVVVSRSGSEPRFRPKLPRTRPRVQFKVQPHALNQTLGPVQGSAS